MPSPTGVPTCKLEPVNRPKKWIDLGYRERPLSTCKTRHKTHLTGIDARDRGQTFGISSRDHLASMIAGKVGRAEPGKE